MYKIKRTYKKKLSISDEAWKTAEIAEINCICSEKFGFMPKTCAKILYNDYGIIIQMETDEKPLLARFQKQNDPVCKDSCMEFFISPNKNDDRYLNFEFNSLGTMYLAVRTSRNDAVFPVEDKEFFCVENLIDENKWINQFTIPFEFIDKLFTSHTHTMLGNLYKCGEDTEKEHYLSYYPLAAGNDDFHQRTAFGEFVLAD